LLFVDDPAVPNLHQPDFYLNNDQPAQPPSGRIAYQQMIFKQNHWATSKNLI
jgi:hypothetical protein